MCKSRRPAVHQVQKRAQLLYFSQTQSCLLFSVETNGFHGIGSRCGGVTKRRRIAYGANQRPGVANTRHRAVASWGAGSTPMTAGRRHTPLPQEISMKLCSPNKWRTVAPGGEGQVDFLAFCTKHREKQSFEQWATLFSLAEKVLQTKKRSSVRLLLFSH